MQVHFYYVFRLEAAYLGCFPLVPNKLVYPEIYPKECVYDTEEELFKILSYYCDNPLAVLEQRKNLKLDFDLYSTEKLLPKYMELFDIK